jgi:pyrroloquinoline quinone biosynthesis protein D
MVEIANLLPDDVLMIPAQFRLQWEPTQNAHVLLYPEGMIKLSDSAAQILKRIDGASSVSVIIEDLEHSFPGTDLKSDVLEFLAIARDRGWITVSAPDRS